MKMPRAFSCVRPVTNYLILVFIFLMLGGMAVMSGHHEEGTAIFVGSWFEENHVILLPSFFYARHPTGENGDFLISEYHCSSRKECVMLDTTTPSWTRVALIV